MQSADLEVGARCRNHTLLYVQEFRRGAPWALKMFDSSAKPESGVLTGGLTSLGFYSECLGALPRMPVIHEPQAKKGVPPFASQYCLLTIGLPDEDAPSITEKHVPDFLWDQIRGKNIRFGICIPSTCNEEDANNIGIQLLQQAGATKNATYSSCFSGAKDYVPRLTFLIVTFILLAYSSLVAAATAYDMSCRWRFSKTPLDTCAGLQKPGTSSMTLERKHLGDSGEEERVNRILLSFSIVKNAEKIFNTGPSNGDFITAIHGIRALSINLIILGHTAEYTRAEMVFRNPGSMAAAISSMAGQIVCNLTLIVDTFFFLTGFLVVYLALKRLKESKGKMNWWIFYLHRYWRLTPLIALISLFYAVYLPYCGEGPSWDVVVAQHRHCKANWWANMIYLQNFLPYGEVCVPHTWYVAVDVQFYLISPPIIYALYRRPRVGIFVIGLLFTLSTTYIVIITVLKELPPTIQPMFYEPRGLDYGQYVYVTPHGRIGPYLVGMISGYIVHTRRGLIVMKKRYVCAGWSACALLMLGVLLAMWPVQVNGGKLPLYASALYSAFSRSIWATCIAWILICCIEGYGGPVNALLSCKPLVPLSRLTFAAYIVHLVPIRVFVNSQQHSFDFSIYLLYIFYIGYLVLTYLVALVVCLLFEAPVFSIEKTLLAGRM